jgi:hypothetical protein
MKIRNLLIIFTLFTCRIFSQDTKFVKYYDSVWSPASKENAMYMTEFEKKDTSYYCTTYWQKSKKIFGKSLYRDTSFQKPLGTLVRFYPTGVTKDSVIYFGNSVIKSFYHYYENGKFHAEYSGDSTGKQFFSRGVDEYGNNIDNFIFEREAEFPGGASAWINLMSKKVNSKVPIKKGAPNGTYPVIVRFIVHKDGTVSDVRAETSFGYGMEEEAIRVMEKSPKWIPAVHYNKPVDAYRRQPLTFVVQ